MNKNYQIIIILCVCLASFSVFYYFVVRSYLEDQPLRDCLADRLKWKDATEGRISKAFSEGKIDNLEKSVSEAKLSGQYEEWRSDCYKKFK